jgi:alpha-L-fucosidase 2
MKTTSLAATCLVAYAMLALPLVAAEPVAPAKPGLQTDVEFAQVGGVSLTLDAFVPAGDGPFPTCIFVHGGGFMRGDKQSYIKPLFEPLGAAGFTWFTINYRLAPDHRWPACAEDVATAVRWVRAHAKQYKVDPQRIALIGESAGGHLVSWHGATMAESKAADSKAAGDATVAAVVPFYAPHDLEMHVRRRNELGPSMTALLGLTELNDEAWKTLRAASPIQKIHPGMPPYLLIHGDADVQVAYEQSPLFQAKMKAAGNVCDLIKIPAGVHGMGGWDKLGSDYREQLIAWLRKTLK